MPMLQLTIPRLPYSAWMKHPAIKCGWLAGCVLAATFAMACGSDGETATGSGASSAGGAGHGGGTGAVGGTAAQGGSNQGGSNQGGSSQGGDGGTANNCDASNCNGPGQLCVNDICVSDCRKNGAVPCPSPTVCNYSDENPGQCVDPGVQDCVLTGPYEACGNNNCGPGSSCDGAGACIAALPCGSLACDGNNCWGESCACTRPPPACLPAPLGSPGQSGTLNDPLFSRCGTIPGNCNGGIADLDFDSACNAFGVTYVSGQDFLRKIDAQGVVSEFGGVTNLNMGEVATQKGVNGTFGGPDLEDVVSLTYICCASCGCVINGGEPQGVARLDVPTSSLPMAIPSMTFTSGSGPFSSFKLNTGPYGLSWGLDAVLYVGNTDSNGQYHALDLTQQNKTLVFTFPERIHASAPFNEVSMLVALQGGAVYRVPVLGGQTLPSLLVTMPADVTSIERDSWSGTIYAKLSNGDIVSFAADGNEVQTFQTGLAQGRIAIAPDGYLYHLTMGFPSQPTITRWPLPTQL